MTVQKDPEGNESKTLKEVANFKDQRVLEIGCGDGRLTRKYSRLVRNVIGIDIDAQELRIANFENSADLRNRVFFVRSDSISLPFPKNSFDLALLSWSL